jgi:hypothetical protein
MSAVPARRSPPARPRGSARLRSCPGEPIRLRGSVVRMNLDREPSAREQVLDQQLGVIKPASRRQLEPDLADGLLTRGHVIEPGSSRPSAPGFGDRFGFQSYDRHVALLLDARTVRSDIMRPSEEASPPSEASMTNITRTAWARLRIPHSSAARQDATVSGRALRLADSCHLRCGGPRHCPPRLPSIPSPNPSDNPFGPPGSHPDAFGERGA